MSDQMTMEAIESEVDMVIEVSKNGQRFQELLSLSEKTLDRLIGLCYHEGIIDMDTASGKIQKVGMLIFMEESWKSARIVIEKNYPQGQRIRTIKK